MKTTLVVLFLILPLCGQQREFEELGSRALAAARAGRFEDAVPAYRRMLQLDPRNAAVRFDLALALNRLGRARESLQVLGTPKEPDALALAGTNLRILGQPQAALTMLQRSFAMSPTPAVAYDVGLTLLDLGRHAEAERVFAKCPENSRCLVGIGLAAFATGRAEDAEKAFQKAAAREPRAADIQASLGDVRLSANQLEQALAAYERAIQLDPASAEYRVKAARALVRLNRESEAAGYLRKALALDPVSAEANAELARLDPGEARRLLETAVAADPMNRTSLYQLMLLCRSQSDASCAEVAKRRFEDLRREDRPVRVSMSPASLIVEGPAEEHRWGRYQFPTMFRMADGRLIVFVHVEADSATAYGSPKRTFVSSDDGFSWREDASAANEAFGLRLANGDWLRIETPASLDAASLKLPESVGAFTSYKVHYSLYRMRDLARELRLIFFKRFAGGKWVDGSTELDDPDGLRYTVENRFPRIWWGDLRSCADGSLLAVTYPSIAAQPPFKFSSACWRSVDRGRTWLLRGRIPYQPDPAADPKAEVRDGFTEPAFERLADGSLYAVLRTTDGNGIGPMYQTRSRDLGRTWTRPKVFASNGVLPRLLRLENGVLVLASGRPGVQLRFSAKGNGEDWSEPWDLLPYDAAKPQAHTCGYTDLVALDRDSFLIVYSWFQKPGVDGKSHKAILARRIHVIKKQ